MLRIFARLIFALSFLLCAQTAFAATAYVQSANGAVTFSGTTTIGVQFSTANVTAGSVISGFIWWGTEGGNLSSVDDDNSNTYTVVASSKACGSSICIQGFYAKNATGGIKPTVTAHLASSNTNKGMAIFEISGADTTAPLDGQVGLDVGTVGGGTNTISSGSWTTSTNGALIMGASMSAGFSGGTDTAGTSSETYTIRESRTANSEQFFTETAVQTTASASTVITFSPAGFTGDAILSGMAFKPAAGAGGAIKNRRTAGVRTGTRSIN